MYRLLIADDEALEREGFEMMITRMMPETFEIFQAENGREAIQMVEDLNLDIVIMDIKMPGIDGLDALKKIKEIQPKIKMVLVTAYDYFGYAKEAVALGVKDYVLKPAKRDQVMELLTKLIEEINKEKDQRQRELILEEKLSALLPIVETEMGIILTMSYVPEQDFHYLAEILDFPIEKGYTAVLSIVPDQQEHWTPVSDEKKMIHEAIKNWLKTNLSCIAGPMIGSQMAVFVSLPPQGYSYSQRVESVEWANRLAQFIEHRFGLHLLVGIGSVRNGLQGFRSSYHEAALAIAAKDYPVPIRHYADLELHSQWEGFSLDEEHRLLEAIRCMDIDQTLTSFHHMFDQLGLENVDIRQKMVTDLFQTLSRHFPFLDLSEMVDFSAAATVEQLRQMAEHRLYSIVEYMKQAKGNKVMTDIERAKQFINQNFAEDLSLETVAEYVNLSPYYFSKIFKSESGHNFSDYLTQQRIVKSKELMADLNLSLKEVSYQVGYKDPNYFSRVFKKVTGTSPSEYRNQTFV